MTVVWSFENSLQSLLLSERCCFLSMLLSQVSDGVSGMQVGEKQGQHYSAAQRLTNVTWMIVSKLNCVPFHRVNSPLWVPVMQRRPSGVQISELTDVRI